jgi:adenylate cyclase
MSTASGNSTIFRYLPRTLIQHWNNSHNPSPLWGEWLHGSLMHCDVTGFTAMSEALAQSGKEGAELMAGILNRFFETMLTIANQWDGIQMKFGGDAMLLFFGEEQHACRAAACGVEMQKAMKEFSNIVVVQATYALRMRIGIHSGNFYSLSLGQETGLLHYMLLGDAVNKTADVEPKAEPGQVVISSDTLQQLTDQFKTQSTAHQGIWEVKKHTVIFHSEADNQQITAVNPVLQRYLMPPIALGSVASLTGEHRRTTMVFISILRSSELLKSSGEAETLRQMNDYMNFVLNGIEKYGGYLITSDVSEHGDKLLIAFGAPLSCERQEENALRFACELNQTLQKSYLYIKHKIGVNSGYVFTGEIGSSRRREYTTIGDTVNLAARLMSAADEGTIIASAATAEKYPDSFDKTALSPISVKGKSQPIPIYRINTMQADEKSLLVSEKSSPFFGRNNEVEKILEIAAHCKQGNSMGIYVCGESGIGKSRLCTEITQTLLKSEWLILSGICQSYTKTSAYRAWYYPLRKIFGITLNDSNDSAYRKLRQAFVDYIPDLEVFSPLIAEMLVIECEKNPILKSLDAKTRRDKRNYTIVHLLKEVANRNSVVIFFDNFQWIDSSSIEIMRSILALSNSPILFCIASRNRANEIDAALAARLTTITLTELNDDDAKQLLAHQGISHDVAERIVERAKGNPLFLEELAKSSAMSTGNLPESVYDLVMSRLDHLDAMKKSLLKNASVIGQIFDSGLLNKLPAAAKEFSDEAGRT